MSGDALHVVGTRALLACLDRGGLHEADRKVGGLLSEHRGHPVSEAEITDLLWGDDPDGGALDTRSSIRVRIVRLRKRGLKILTLGGGRYAVGMPTPEHWPNYAGSGRRAA